MDIHSSNQNGRQYEHLRCTGCYNKPGHPKVCNCRKYFHLNKAIAFCILALQQRAQDIGNGYSPEVEAKLPPEVLNLRQQILDLQRQNDQSAIIAKEQRLENLIRTSELNFVADATRNHVLRSIVGDDGFWFGATREQLTVIFQELVSSATCSRYSSAIAHNTSDNFLLNFIIPYVALFSRLFVYKNFSVPH